MTRCCLLLSNRPPAAHESQPNQFSATLVINTKTATALGLAIRPMPLARAASRLFHCPSIQDYGGTAAINCKRPTADVTRSFRSEEYDRPLDIVVAARTAERRNLRDLIGSFGQPGRQLRREIARADGVDVNVVLAPLTGTGTCLDSIPTYPPRRVPGASICPTSRPLTALRCPVASSRASMTLLPTRPHAAQEYFDC